ncbi:MAG TPA: alpha/beta hydrolase [Gammaproteobacteria bacterium]|nr:alpha/beta hydrolase [Gammaproteobacteria bacterium]
MEGPAGRLELRVDLPQEEPRALAVICHPHPLHGGSLDNKVVHQLARAFSEQGAVSVRFNFRGVGNSEGAYDEGRGEREDLLAVTGWARKRWPELPLWLAGFSFGGLVALAATAELAPDWLVTVAPAVSYFPVTPGLPPHGRWLLIQGTDDEIVPAKDVEAWLASAGLSPEKVFVEGAGHFFHGRLNRLREAVAHHAPR